MNKEKSNIVAGILIGILIMTFVAACITNLNDYVAGAIMTICVVCLWKL